MEETEDNVKMDLNPTSTPEEDLHPKFEIHNSTSGRFDSSKENEASASEGSKAQELKKDLERAASTILEGKTPEALKPKKEPKDPNVDKFGRPLKFAKRKIKMVDKKGKERIMELQMEIPADHMNRATRRKYARAIAKMRAKGK